MASAEFSIFSHLPAELVAEVLTSLYVPTIGRLALTTKSLNTVVMEWLSSTLTLQLSHLPIGAWWLTGGLRWLSKHATSLKHVKVYIILDEMIAEFPPHLTWESQIGNSGLDVASLLNVTFSSAAFPSPALGARLRRLTFRSVVAKDLLTPIELPPTLVSLEILHSKLPTLHMQSPRQLERLALRHSEFDFQNLDQAAHLRQVHLYDEEARIVPVLEALITSRAVLTDLHLCPSSIGPDAQALVARLLAHTASLRSLLTNADVEYLSGMSVTQLASVKTYSLLEYNSRGMNRLFQPAQFPNVVSLFLDDVNNSLGKAPLIPALRHLSIHKGTALDAECLAWIYRHNDRLQELHVLARGEIRISMPQLLRLDCQGFDEISVSIDSAPLLYKLSLARAEIKIGYHAAPALQVIQAEVASSMRQASEIATSAFGHLCCLVVPPEVPLETLGKYFEGQPLNLIIYNQPFREHSVPISFLFDLTQQLIESKGTNVTKWWPFKWFKECPKTMADEFYVYDLDVFDPNLLLVSNANAFAPNTEELRISRFHRNVILTTANTVRRPLAKARSNAPNTPQPSQTKSEPDIAPEGGGKDADGGQPMEQALEGEGSCALF